MTTGVVQRVLSHGEKQLGETKLPFQTLEVWLSPDQNLQPANPNPEANAVIISREAQDSGSFPLYQVGDKVTLEKLETPTGTQWQITDYARLEPLLVLGLIFAVMVIAIGKWRGFWSLLALAFSFGVLTKLTLPLIMWGWNPVLVSLLTAALILPTNFYLSHGWQAKTHLALISTLTALGLTSLLAMIFINLAHLSGLASEEAGFLLVEKAGLINLKNLVLAGVIVGAMGVFDDITVSQASVVFELKRANPKFGWLDLYTRGMKIGQDHISSMANTLVLVYAGAALPLLLMFTQSSKGVTELLNQEIMAEEIIRTLTGSIGLIVAAPLTTAITALALTKGWVNDSDANVSEVKQQS